MYPILVQVSNDTGIIAQRSFRYIAGRTAIQFLLDRLRSNYDGSIILVTSDLDIDDVYESISKDNNIGIYRGSSKKCLTRLAGAMKMYGMRGFIRVYGNYPLLDIGDMIKMADMHKLGNYEYSYNEHTSGLMIGAGCDVFSEECVEKLMLLGLKTSQEETIGFYIRQNEDKYRISRFISDKTRKVYNYRISLECEKDLDVINDIAQNVELLSNESIGRYLENHPVLAEYNLPIFAKEVETDKFYIHPEKVAAVMRADTDYSFPISIEINLTNKSNFKSINSSSLSLLEKHKGEFELPKERYFNLMEDLASGGTQGVILTGNGEPTSCSFFSEAIDYTRRCGLAIGVVTDGIQRIENDVVEKIEWIRISLDATTSKEYRKLKGIDFYEQVLNNVFHYSHHCETVGVSFVVTPQNVSYVEELVMRLREFGISYVEFKPYDSDMDLRSEPVNLSYLKNFETIAFAVNIDDKEKKGDATNNRLPCLANSVTSVVMSDGGVYLCRGLSNYKWVRPIGNINNQTFHDIWYGKERKRQLETVETANFCRVNCPPCRISKLNSDIYRMRSTKTVHFI